MRYRICLLLLIFYSISLSACSDTGTVLGPKREVTEYNESTLEVEQPLYLDITCDSGNIEVYSWDGDRIKFGIVKKIRGIEDQHILEKKLGDFKIDIKQEDNKVSLSSRYKGSIKNAIDRKIDLQIFMPKKIEAINCKLDLGTIKIFDDIKCDFNAEVKTVNIDINRIIGRLNLKGDMSSLRIQGGKIKGDSTAKVNFGNFIIKADFEKDKNYSFETGVGNIELTIPEDSEINFENIGNLEVNEFPAGLYPTKVTLNSGMGRISIKKY